MTRQSTRRQILSELTRALCVLALLVFGLVPAAASDVPAQVGVSRAVAVAIATAAATELCGGGWGDQHFAHAPCHACRSNAAALPPVPAVAEPVAFMSDEIAYTPTAGGTVAAVPTGPPPPRGPPLA